MAGRDTLTPTNRQTLPWYTPALGLADMGAATVRGVTRGTLGLPGDLESLVRMITGGEQQLPTSNDWDKKLPPMQYLANEAPKGRSPFDDIGQFYNVPIYGGAIGAAGKGIKKLGGKIVGGETNLGRREFAKKAGAIGLGSTALMKAVKYLDELETAVKPTAKIPDGWDKVDGSGYVRATKAVPKYKYNSLKEYTDDLNVRSREGYSSTFPQENTGYLDNVKAQLAKSDEEAYNLEKAHINSSLFPEDEPYTVLHNFSPQAKAEMKAFKEQADNWSYSKAESQADAMEGFGWNTSKEYDSFIDNIRDNSHWTDFLDDYVKNFK